MQIQLHERCDSTAAILLLHCVCAPQSFFLNGIGAGIALLLEEHVIDELVLCSNTFPDISMSTRAFFRVYVLAQHSTGELLAAFVGVKR